MAILNQALEIIGVITFSMGFLATMAFVRLWVLIFREAWSDYIEELAKRYPKR